MTRGKGNTLMRTVGVFLVSGVLAMSSSFAEAQVEAIKALPKFEYAKK
jgi:hypothetical protein